MRPDGFHIGDEWDVEDHVAVKSEASWGCLECTVNSCAGGICYSLQRCLHEEASIVDVFRRVEVAQGAQGIAYRKVKSFAHGIGLWVFGRQQHWFNTVRVKASKEMVSNKFAALIELASNRTGISRQPAVF